MRDDFAKVIVERPRHESKWDRPKGRRQNLDQEDLPRFEGIKKLKGGTKSLNENLAPLRRFINGQVGRPWNKVFSEINEYIKPGNTVQEHVLGHIDDFIERKVTKVPVSEKYPCGLRSHGRRGWISAIREGDLYVDPVDGIIKKARRKLFVPQPKKAWRVAVYVGKDRIAVMDDGVWYSVEVAHFELSSYTRNEALKPFREGKKPYIITRTIPIFIVNGERVEGVSDAIKGWVLATETLSLQKLYGAKNVYGKLGTKRQLNAQDLKRLGLKNDVPERSRA